MASAMTAVPLQHCFPPVVDAETRLLVLGSLPGAMSLAEQRYYANPRNQFWLLLETVTGGPLNALPYEERLATLRRHHVGLWDTVAAARRPGSLDAAIRLEAASDLGGLARSLPSLRAIAFNGGTAARIGRGQFGDAPRWTLIDLPSSSPAHTRPFAEKAAAWSALARYLD